MKKQIHFFLTDKDNGAVQFIKYGVCGGIATAVDIAVFFLLAWLIFPALTETDPFTRALDFFQMEIRPVSEAVRLRNYWINRTVCFLISNLAAYILNVLFVFKRGRHRVHHEIFLFYAVSLAAFFGGTFAGDILIRFFSLDTTYSYLAAVIFAVLINYTGRKFYIFRG